MEQMEELDEIRVKALEVTKEDVSEVLTRY